ncbi:MAG: ADP-dependent glucokinase/phosphofructokinase [Chitinophagales bacterium]
MSSWETLYQDAWVRFPARLSATKGVVVGFHSVVDGLQRVKPEWLDPLLKDQELMREVRERKGEVPLALESPADLMVGLLESMRAGKALQRMMRREELFRWSERAIGYERPRLGGTSGNMANSLAPLGLPLLVYAYPLSRQLADLFVPLPNLTVLAEEGGEIRRLTPREVEAPETINALHLIVEYPKGYRVEGGGEAFETPRANRFIAGWNPTNSQLRINPVFRRGLLERAHEFSHFIISGFHILAETYADGTTYKECLLPVAEFCRELKARNPQLKLHYEFASIGSPLIRKGILDWILPVVDSLGLNEVELASLLGDAGEHELVARLKAEESPAAYLEGVRVILERGGLKRVQLHNLGYYLTLSRPGYSDLADARDSLLLAAVLAAARTASGRTGTPEEMAAGLAEPLAEPGLKALAALAAFTGEEQLAATGLGRYAGLQLACVPTRLVANPVLTVGLGDLISATAFVFDGPLG